MDLPILLALLRQVSSFQSTQQCRSMQLKDKIPFHPRNKITGMAEPRNCIYSSDLTLTKPHLMLSLPPAINLVLYARQVNRNSYNASEEASINTELTQLFNVKSDC